MYRILRVHLAVALDEALAVAQVLQEAAVVEVPLVVVGHRAPGKEGLVNGSFNTILEPVSILLR